MTQAITEKALLNLELIGVSGREAVNDACAVRRRGCVNQTCAGRRRD
jgi:hypothetical protein